MPHDKNPVHASPAVSQAIAHPTATDVPRGKQSDTSRLLPRNHQHPDL
jgi:hypothetical protein